MKDEKDIDQTNAQVTGRTEEPADSDNIEANHRAEDNRNQYDQENSANGLDSLQVRGGQDGRNERGIGSTDMDTKNGVLRMGDNANSTLELTEEGLASAVADEAKTNTAMVDVTTHGPDDYASDDKVPVPKAEEAAKKQNNGEKASSTDETQQDREAEIAETGTNLTNKPTY